MRLPMRTSNEIREGYQAFFEEMHYRQPAVFTSGLVSLTPDTADVVGRPVPQPAASGQALP